MKRIKALARSINWKLWAGLLISALFLYLAFRKVDLAKVWKVIQSADILFLSMAIVITFFQYVIRAWRWSILLEPVKKTGFPNRLHSTTIGFAANCILPARLGEFIRANYLGNSEGMSSSSTFGTIVVERLFDGFTLLLILLIGLIGTDFPVEWRYISGSLRSLGFLLLSLYILLIIFLLGFKYKARSFLNILDRALFFIPVRFRSKISDIIWNFSLGLVLVKGPYKWVQAIFFSFLLWLSAIFQIQFIQQSIGLALPYMAPFLVLAMTSFGVMIPSAPGYIGTFHLAAQYGFIFYGIGREEALSAAILYHAVSFLPTILFGFISFLLLNIQFKQPSKDPTIIHRGL